MDFNKIKSIVARTATALPAERGLDVAGWTLRRIETDATTVIRVPGIYTIREGKSLPEFVNLPLAVEVRKGGAQ